MLLLYFQVHRFHRLWNTLRIYSEKTFLWVGNKWFYFPNKIGNERRRLICPGYGKVKQRTTAADRGYVKYVDDIFVVKEYNIDDCIVYKQWILLILLATTFWWPDSRNGIIKLEELCGRIRYTEYEGQMRIVLIS